MYCQHIIWLHLIHAHYLFWVAHFTDMSLRLCVRLINTQPIQAFQLDCAETYRETLLTCSMVQSPSWEVHWFAASQEIPRISRNRRFITALTSIRHLSLFWAGPIQSIYPHPTSWRSILILSTHRRLGLPSGILPSGFPIKTLYTPSPHPYAPHAQRISFFSILSPAPYWARSTNHLAQGNLKALKNIYDHWYGWDWAEN